MSDAATIVSPLPLPVEVANEHPLAVEVVTLPAPLPVTPDPAKPRPVQMQQSQTKDPSLPARTTFQEDLVTASQRRVNLIWEYTQAAIALLVVTSTMGCGIIAMIYESKQIPTIIGVAFGMVTGFYFSRTNHEKIGGIGMRPRQTYKGR